MIVGMLGWQRSGKSSMAMLLGRFFQEKFNLKIYTNMEARNCTIIERLTDIPSDNEPKIVIWDEIHFSMDSRDITKNKDFSIFLSTLGKQKILLIWTCPTPDLVDKRIRKITSYYALCKGDKEKIYVQWVDALKVQASQVFIIEKNQKYFDYLAYNSNLVIPNIIEANIRDYVEYVKQKQFI